MNMIKNKIYFNQANIGTSYTVIAMVKPSVCVASVNSGLPLFLC